MYDSDKHSSLPLIGLHSNDIVPTSKKPSKGIRSEEIEKKNQKTFFAQNFFL
jgi:hypothetical protein